MHQILFLQHRLAYARVWQLKTLVGVELSHKRFTICHVAQLYLHDLGGQCRLDHTIGPRESDRLLFAIQIELPGQLTVD